MALVGAAGLLAFGLGAAGVRVAIASQPAPFLALEELPPPGYPRIDRAAPELGLVAQSGERVALASLRGRPALVTFAFAHCETVCPLVVRQALEAQSRLRAQVDSGTLAPERVPRVVVVTLDPAPTTAIVDRLRLVAKAENVRVADEQLTTIAMRSGGDIRAALNDLQILSTGKSISKEELDLLSDREHEEAHCWPGFLPDG